jgi:hypothetical protein
MCRDTFIPRTKYLGSIILLTAWTDDLFRAVPSFPFFPYWSNHYYPHHSSTLLLLALGEYFPCQQNTVPLTSICLLAGLSLTAYALVFRRRPHYFPSSLTAIRCCGPYTALSKRRTASSHSPQIPLASLSVRRKHSRCTSGYLHRPSFQYAASAASAAFPTSLPFPVLHLSRANAIPHGALAFELRLAPGQRVPNSTYRHFQSFPRNVVYLLYSRTATGFSRTAPLQWCLSPMYSLADAAYRRQNAEPAYHRFLPASLPSTAFHGSTPSGWASCLHRHILLLLSRHPAFHGRSQSLYIASPNHPATCGTWSCLVVSRWTIYFPKLRLLPFHAPALLALSVAPTHCTPPILFYSRP